MDEIEALRSYAARSGLTAPLHVDVADRVLATIAAARMSAIGRRRRGR